MERIIIIGAGGHAKVVIDIILHEKKYQLFGLIDNNFPLDHEVLGFKVLGSDDELSSIIEKNHICGGVIAVGDNYRRYEIFKNIKKINQEFQFINCIHPKSNIGIDVKIGEGNVVMAGVTVNSSTTIGDHCILNTNCSIDHDNNISSFTSIAPNAVCGGNVTINQYSAVGIGATILHNITVGTNCIVGANSLVNKDADSNSVYYGVPAQFIREHQFGCKYL